MIWITVAPGSAIMYRHRLTGQSGAPPCMGTSFTAMACLTIRLLNSIHLRDRLVTMGRYVATSNAAHTAFAFVPFQVRSETSA